MNLCVLEHHRHEAKKRDDARGGFSTYLIFGSLLIVIDKLTST